MTLLHARRVRLAAVLTASALAVPVLALPAGAEGYRAVTGSGSTWSANMVEQWTADVKQFGISVSFSATGSSTGRREFGSGTVDFAVSEIPYGLTDAQGVYDKPPSRGFAYLPIVAGGTAFMYNLKVAGKRVTNLRLSGVDLTKIFTGEITRWNDPALKRDNPRIALPDRLIVPVVRSDGSGTTAQFTSWMAKVHPTQWNAFCRRQNISFTGNCPFTSNYPSVKGFVSQSGSLGVSGYVSTPSAEGAINFVEYSYALRAKFPVVKLLNSSGYYVEPTDEAVAVGLLGAKINQDKADKNTYLTQILDGVYRNADRRAYPLSSYSYMIIPTAEGGTFKADKGRALGDFLYHAICEGQQAAGVLGYSPLPQNLVKAGLEQVRLIPGVDAQKVQLANCNNPTFSADGTNTLAKTAPQPPACDKQGLDQCLTGTGGARGVSTHVSNRGSSSTGGATGGGAGSAAASGGVTTGTAVGGATGAAATGTTGGGTTGATGAVDPFTGVPAATTGGAGGELVSGVAVSSPVGTGGAAQTWYMVLAALALLAGIAGPPLLLQRSGRHSA